EIDRLHHEVVSIHVFGALARGALELGLADMRRDTPHNSRSDAILQIKQFAEAALIAIRPDHGVGLNVGELDADANLVAASAHAAGQHVAHAKLLADFSDIDFPCAVGQGGRMGDHEQAPYARERHDDVVDHSVSEIGVFRIVSAGPKRHDRDRWYLGASGRLTMRDGTRSCSNSGNAQRKGVDGARYVLKPELAKIVDRHVDPCADYLAQGIRNHDAACRRILLETGRNVDAGAVDVFGFDDHVADIETHAHLNSAILRLSRFTLRNFALDLERAAQGVDGAVEGRDKSVASIAYDASSVGNDAWVDDLNPNCA